MRQRFLAILLLLSGAFALGLLSWSAQAYWPDAAGYAQSVAAGRWVAHPPGYLFFVATGRAVHLLVADPYQSVQIVSFGAWLFSIPAMFLALRRMVDGYLAGGLAAAFGLCWIPLVISHAGTSHAVDLLLVTLLLGLISQPAFSGKAMAFYFWALLGITAGFRLTTLVMLAPMVIIVLWQQRRSVSHWVGAGLLAIWVLLLYGVTIHLSGGWEAYSAYAASEAGTARPSSLFLNGFTGPVGMNIFRSLFWFLSATGCLLVPALVGWIQGNKRCGALPGSKNDDALVYLASILGPLGVTTFYLATHPGYLAPALPGVFFLAACGCGHEKARKVWPIALGLQIALSLGWFFGLSPLQKPVGKRQAALNALVLQYTHEGVRTGTFRTLSGWLVVAGEQASVPQNRLEALQQEAEREKKERLNH